MSSDDVRTVADDIFDPAPIQVAGRSFVITGKLEISKRTPFLERLAAVGAVIQNDVVSTTDYLVVGMQGSAAWVSARFGTKIEKAMLLKRERGAQTKIVREVAAMEALVAQEQASKRGSSV